MSTNPYEPIDLKAEELAPGNEKRNTARRMVRLTLLILLIPAIYNLIGFSFYPISGKPSQLRFQPNYLTLNSILLIAIFTAIWFIGLIALEFVTGGIHAIVAKNSKLDDWKESLYNILHRAPVVAVPGAVLWAISVLAIYQLRLNYFAIAVPIGIAGHCLGACLYVPLFYRWYKLERPAAPQTPR
jgi:hypothetical protein